MEKHKTKQEKIDAIKNSITLRDRWLESVHLGLNAEEMERKGIKTLPITK